MEALEETARVVTSKPVQRAAVNVVLLFSGAVTLFGLASLATLLFFQNFVPDQFITTPVYLQYESGANPYGVARLMHPVPKLQQDYDISVSLSMPRSPPNNERGNFMVSIYLVKDDDKGRIPGANGKQSVHGRQFLDSQNVLFKSRRPALMPFEDPIISVAKRVLFMGYYILFPRSQACTMTVQLAEKVSFDKGATQPTAAFVEIEAGQNIHIYDTTLTLAAQLRGLRWLMFHYRLVTFMAFNFLFWACEVLFMCVAWAIWSATTTPGSMKGKGGFSIDSEHDNDDGERFEHVSGYESHERKALKSETEVKFEELDDPGQAIADIPLAGAEADDEADFDEDDEDDSGGKRLDFGSGTSYRGEGSESVRRRASRKALA